MLLIHFFVFIFLGLPNTFGDYDETPEMMAGHIKVGIAKRGLNLNFNILM